MKVTQFVENNSSLMYKMLEELCKIPAPSHHEEKRAEYCKSFLEDIGAECVYIDEALNVVFPMDCEGKDNILVFTAHTDTVFPDTAPMPYIDDGKKIYCPGVGDDTAHLVGLLMIAKYFVEQKIKTDGVLFVCNSCEEGLGNLKGTRQIFKDYEGRIGRFISFDSKLNVIDDKCVGSHRYEVEVLTEGGHSYSAFGNNNAINEISKIVNAIYDIKVPEKDGATVTYNVGEIRGGTSVNTIAQNATILCEYRSDDADCLDIMKARFTEIFKKANTPKVKVNVRCIGERPCSKTDYSKVKRLVDTVKPIIEGVSKHEVQLKAASTDANVPLSIGVPAITIGLCETGNAHTREEWVEKSSVPVGTEIGIRTALELIKQ